MLHQHREIAVYRLPCIRQAFKSLLKYSLSRSQLIQSRDLNVYKSYFSLITIQLKSILIFANKLELFAIFML